MYTLLRGGKLSESNYGSTVARAEVRPNLIASRRIRRPRRDFVV